MRKPADLPPSGEGAHAVRVQTNLARLINEEMAAQNLSGPDVERLGGPKKQALSYLLTKWSGTRSLDAETLTQLAHALRISRRSLGRAVAVDLGLLPDDDATVDELALLTDALREEAEPWQRDIVVAAARSFWRALDQQEADSHATPIGADPTELEAAEALRQQAIAEGDNLQQEQTMSAPAATKRPPRRQ